MKRRVFTLLNFLALNVLFFAIYLNFIHKDVNTLTPVSAAAKSTVTSLAAIQQKKAIAANIPQPKNGMAVSN